MALEGELSFITDPEGLTLRGVLGIRRLISYRNFLNILVKGSDEPLMGRLVHAEINDYGGNILGRIGADWSFSCDINKANIASMHEFVFRMTYKGREPVDVNFSAEVILESEGEPRWMVPGVFYKHGRPASDEAAPNYRAFRSDRSSHPGVFGWTERSMACLTLGEQINGRVTGVYFRSDGETKAIGVHFPCREKPDAPGVGNPAPNSDDIDWLHVEPNDKFQLRFKLYFGPGNLHKYNDVLRDRYYQDTRTHHCHPRLEALEVCDLAVESLLKRHYDPTRAVLYETSAFDLAAIDSSEDTLDLADTSCAHALLWYGRKFANTDCTEAAVSLLDKTASGLAPAGTFWPKLRTDGAWTAEEGNRLGAWRAAETTLFLAQAFAREMKAGNAHPAWERAVLSSLDFVRAIQRDDGGLGSSYDAGTGEVTDWDGAAGLLWVAALIEGYRFSGNFDYLQAATLGGQYYARFVEDECIFGADGRFAGTPSSVDGYNGLLAYMRMYQEDANAQWLNLAKRTADWIMTFRCCYNAAFSADTILGRHDFRTRGADIAAPARPGGQGGAYLHSRGLVCHGELVELGHHLGDGYYLERARDGLQCFRQLIACNEGDFGAHKGMAPGRFYHTHAQGPKGEVGHFASASCTGLVLYANMWDIEHTPAAG